VGSLFEGGKKIGHWRGVKGRAIRPSGVIHPSIGEGGVRLRDRGGGGGGGGGEEKVQQGISWAYFLRGEQGLRLAR